MVMSEIRIWFHTHFFPLLTSEIIIHQTHYEKSDWSRAFNQFTIACELDMINAISAADIAFIMPSSTSAWLLSPLECSQKQNGWTLRFCFRGWIMWKMCNKTIIIIAYVICRIIIIIIAYVICRIIIIIAYVICRIIIIIIAYVIWIIKTSCLCYRPPPSASADNTDLGFDNSASADNTDLSFDNSWYHPHPHPIFVYYFLMSGVFYWLPFNSTIGYRYM